MVVVGVVMVVVVRVNQDVCYVDNNSFSESSLEVNQDWNGEVRQERSNWLCLLTWSSTGEAAA